MVKYISLQPCYAELYVLLGLDEVCLNIIVVQKHRSMWLVSNYNINMLKGSWLKGTVLIL